MSPQLLDTLGMFAFLTVELSVLFIAISLLVGALQRRIPPERVAALLSSSRRSSYFLAAGLAAITPFCSCSTIPMLKGMIRARAGFGPMMVFLFVSPLLNPIIVVLLAVTFGMTLTTTYVLAALVVSLSAGWLLEAWGFERYIRGQEAETVSSCSTAGSSCTSAPVISGGGAAVYALEAQSSQSGGATIAAAALSTSCGPSASAKPATITGKYSGLWQEAWSDFVDVVPYLLIGTAIGSVIYGFMPAGLLEQYAGSGNPFAIPVAAVIGVPLYIRTEAVIPLAAALMAKGIGAGTVLALIIGSAGASLTELILLRALFNFKLLAAFVTVVIAMAMVAGYATFLFF